ncbi:MBL fold metallo-hydrolase [Chitinimonas sp. BJB300]|uniref:MBL fold metallo-hydrolase n=1 Tax=Chitinimonas sp. BJB300 TaxID=1559339 RepID=UPI000C0DC9E7|nr:MBL fold metallo-hydrolase [Chitinimonas sp. BJB300]PHV12895.1 MBL fold metallo-hydrolase [Chitinimonas sp. BJB300]TSJ88464.1 MBL fold metallo-hydrolase [Chitinimonas sp. BJB300]
MSQPAHIEAFFDPTTWTISYVVYDQVGGSAAILDPVLDYDPKSGRTGHDNAQKVLDFVHAHSLTVTWILETHAHADHLSAAAWLKQQVGGKVAIGAKIGTVQQVFKTLFNLEADFATDGSQFDHLFEDDETFAIGTLSARAIAVPGHTPADLAYQVGDAVFIGDTLFMPDVGSARCDFPGGNAATLYQSVRKLLNLPAQTRLFLCHDYPPENRKPQWQTTVAAQRAANIHLHDGVDEATFVAMRTQRDKTLGMPMLILPAIQVNIRAGVLPPADTNGIRYLRIPMDAL